MRSRVLTVILSLSAMPAGAAGQGANGGPSFSCSPPASYARKLVCEDPDLSREDRDLAARWRLELAHDPSGRAHQAGPAVMRQLDACHSQACVSAWFRQREHDTLLGDRPKGTQAASFTWACTISAPP